jgi:hypothetical protein
MPNTTVMVFKPRSDYALLLITRNDGVQQRIITLNSDSHANTIDALTGDEPLQAKSIVVIPGDRYEYWRS